MQTRTPAGTLVQHPSGTTIQTQAAPTGRRRNPASSGDPISEALLSGVTGSDIKRVDDLVIVPSAEFVFRGPTRAGGDEEGVTVAVPTQPGEAAVLLVERDGVYAWQLPEPAGPTQARRGPPGTTVFRVGPGAAVPGPAGQRRNLLGDVAGVILEPVRTIVLKLAARQLVGAGLTRLERNVKPGLIEITGPDPRKWAAATPQSFKTRDDGQKPRILLLVHGTFSSSVGSFGALGATPFGRTFLEQARQRYDAILGYDHATLSAPPEANAQGILGALRGLQIGAPPQIDAVAFSRGGLVYRYLAERLAQQENQPFEFGRTVFIGCTNGGTELAEPENWHEYLDLYTNLAAAAGRGLSLFDGGIAGTVLSESVKTLGGLVQAVVSAAIDDGMLPGLAAMRPHGPLVTSLNAAPERGNGEYFAMGASFAPELATTLAPPGSGLPRKLLLGLAAHATHRLMGDANDLVVDTEAMTSFGQHAGQVAGRKKWERSGSIYHTNYFLQPEIIEQTRTWLALDNVSTSQAAASKAQPAPELPSAFPTLDEDRAGLVEGNPAQESDAGDALSFPRPSVRRGPTFDHKPLAALPRPASPPPAPARQEVDYHFGAEMAEHPPVERPARLTVTVSLEDILIMGGPTRSTAIGRVQSGVPLRLSIEARSNCTVVDVDSVEVTPPSPNTPDTYDFKIQGSDVGPAELWVEAHQGQRRLMRIVLQPDFVATGAILRATGRANSREPVPPLVELRIYEESDGDDSPFRLRFVLESRDLDVSLNIQTDKFKVPQQQYVNSLYDKLEGHWGSNREDFDEFMSTLTDFGASLYEDLVPKEMRQALWDNRDRIGAIEVISHEPHIPWEIAHLKEPGKTLPPQGNRFMAELGLIRWVSNANFPPARLRVRDGLARYVVPDYPDDGFKLPGAQAEIALLKREFNATAAPPNTRELKTVLAEPGAFDLLHLACHGSANPARIWEASLMMEGRMEAGVYVQDKLEVATVRNRAQLKQADGGRPIVFLNACQAGRTGRTLSGIGGMADAFIRAGAGLFVGTLWSIGDDVARMFSGVFYDQLKRGASLTEATRSARQAARRANEPTWLAYTVYGHPYATLSTQ